MFGLFLLLPVIAPYVLSLPGGNLRLAGLAVGIYGLTQAAMLAPLGWVSDRIGRKPVLIVGLLVYALGGYLAGAIEHPTTVVLGRALQGLGAISAVVFAAISDSTATQTRAQAMAVVGVGIGLAFGAAVVLAGPLAAWLGVAGILRATAWLGLIALAVVVITPLPKHKAKMSGGIVDVRLLPLCLGVFVIHLAMAAVFVHVPLSLAQLIDTDRLWQVYLTSFVLGAAVAVPLIIRYSQAKEVVIGTAVAVGISLLGIVMFGYLGAIAITAALVMFFAGYSYLEAVLPVRASLLALPGSRGATMGVYAISQALGVFAGSFLAGELRQEYNQLSLIIAAVGTIIWSGAYFYFNTNKA